MHRRIALIRAAILAVLVHAGPAAAQDAKAVDRATAMRQRGARPDEIVAELARAYRLDARGVAQVLARADMPAAEALPALESAFRLKADAAGTILARGGYTAEATARALQARGTRSADVVASLRLADIDPRELRRVAIDVLRMTAAEYAASMKAAGVPVLDVARVLKDGYRLAAAAGGDVLLDAGYSHVELATAFRLVWELDATEAYAAIQEMSTNVPAPWTVLGSAGYDIVRPTIHGYRIADYRPGHDGEWIENIGVVDPDRVTPINPDPWLGEVEILLGMAELDDLVATIALQPGEILGRTPHTFQASNGATLHGEWLRVRFRDFESGSLAVRRFGGGYTVPALALAFHLIDAELIEGPLGSLSIALGDPIGEGTVTLPAGTHGGIPVSERTIGLTLPAYAQAGVTANLVELSSSNVDVNTRAAGDGVVQIEVKISFEESGAEIQGMVMNAVPFEADLISPALTIAITIGPQGTSGAFAAYSVLPEFTTGVELRSVVGGVSVGPIRDWVLGDVNAQLLATFQQMDLGATIVQALETGRDNLGWGHVRGVYVLNDGRWFIDAQH